MQLFNSVFQIMRLTETKHDSDLHWLMWQCFLRWVCHILHLTLVWWITKPSGYNILDEIPTEKHTHTHTPCGRETQWEKCTAEVHVHFSVEKHSDIFKSVVQNALTHKPDTLFKILISQPLIVPYDNNVCFLVLIMSAPCSLQQI